MNSKEWRLKNPERACQLNREGMRRWRENNPERAKEIAQKCNRSEKRKLRMTKWREENKDRIKLLSRIYREKTKDRKSVYASEWKAKNPDKVKAASKRHREKLKTLIINHYSDGKNKCNCCGETLFEFLTIDHINGN